MHARVFEYTHVCVHVHFMCMWEHVQIQRGKCEFQRRAFDSQFSPVRVCVLGIKLSQQASWEELLPKQTLALIRLFSTQGLSVALSVASWPLTRGTYLPVLTYPWTGNRNAHHHNRMLVCVSQTWYKLLKQICFLGYYCHVEVTF